jgi:hypothetical protein
MLAIAGVFVSADAIARYGDRTQQFGWTAVREGGEFVAQVEPDGPVAGTLFTGDTIVALNGDRRASRVSPQVLRMFLRDPAYTLTVRRRNVESTIALTWSVVASTERLRFAWSIFFVGVVFCLTYTIVAALRPDRPIARLAFVAGMSTGLVMLSNAAGFSTPWMPHIQAVATQALFPLAPLHLAIGCSCGSSQTRGSVIAS